MAQYDANDWTARLLAMFPRRWRSSAAASSGGIVYATLQSTGTALASLSAQLAYLKLQTRLLTSTDSNLDAKAADFFGFGAFLRALGEVDAAYAARIQQRIIAPLSTRAGIQAIVQAVINAQANAPYLSQPIALDVSGALDTVGALDGGALADPATILPTVTVFDWQDNPNLSQLVGLAQDEGQFAIMFTFPSAATKSQWFLGEAFLGVNTFLASPNYEIISTPPPGIDPLVQAIKAQGTWPIYVSNIPA